MKIWKRLKSKMQKLVVTEQKTVVECVKEKHSATTGKYVWNAVKSTHEYQCYSGKIKLNELKLAFDDGTKLNIDNWGPFRTYLEAELSQGLKPILQITTFAKIFPLQIRYENGKRRLFCNVVSYSLLLGMLVACVLLPFA
jgi:hypothetical protein